MTPEPLPEAGNSWWFRLRSFTPAALWQEEATGLRGLVLKTLRLFILACRGLLVNRALIRASALAYLTGLAIIPLLALLFAILKSLGIQRLLATHLLEHLAPGSKDFALQILHYIESTQVASLGVFGIVALLADLIILMTNVERAFNDTWQVGRTRPWRRKLSDYLSIFLILPLLMAVAISLATAFLSHPEIRRLISGVVPEAWFSATSGLVSLGLFWLAFTFIYLVMPNTKVHFLSAVLGGLVGTLLWEGAQMLLAWAHAQASYYNAIYGVVYHLLFFTLWMYWSWLTVLFGNEVAYAHQNLGRLTEKRRYPGPVAEPVDEYLALAGLVAVSERFLSQKPPINLEELGHTLRNGDPMALRVVDTLKQLKLIVEVAPVSADAPPRYLPAVPPDQLKVGQILGMLREARVGTLAREWAADPGLSELLRRLAQGSGQGPWDHLSLEELVAQATPGVTSPFGENRKARGKA